MTQEEILKALADLEEQLNNLSYFFNLKTGQGGSITGLIQLPNYTVANLPSSGVPSGALAYTTNGRKNGETAGNGTGVVVFRDTTAWRACDTGATVAA